MPAAEFMTELAKTMAFRSFPGVRDMFDIFVVLWVDR